MAAYVTFGSRGRCTTLSGVLSWLVLVALLVSVDAAFLALFPFIFFFPRLYHVTYVLFAAFHVIGKASKSHFAASFVGFYAEVHDALHGGASQHILPGAGFFVCNIRGSWCSRIVFSSFVSCSFIESVTGRDATHVQSSSSILRHSQYGGVKASVDALTPLC